MLFVSCYVLLFFVVNISKLLLNFFFKNACFFSLRNNNSFSTRADITTRIQVMVAVASLSAGTLNFHKFPPSVALKNPNPSDFNPHIAVALGTNEGHLVPIMKVELPDGKIIEPDAYRNLQMLEEFEIHNPSEYLHFEVLDVERTREEKENVKSVDGKQKEFPKENPKYVVIASKSIAVSHMLEDNWSHKLYGHCFKYINLDSPDGKEKNVCTMKLQMDYNVVSEE